jgi:hypothetical protein
MTTHDTYKSPTIVKNKVVLEEITFRGKKIIRESIVKEWNIPKIIKHDIGYQLMFGHRDSLRQSKKSVSGIVERTLEY